MAKSKIQVRTAQVQRDSFSEENRTAVFVISSEAVDSYNTVFLADGWDTRQYMRNPVVTYNHSAHSNDPDTIIGITERIWREDQQLLAEVRFESADINPLAEKIMRKVQAGTLRMASINANVEKYRWGDKEKGENPDVVYFSRQKLIEWSIVSVGSNPDALKRSKEELTAIKAEKNTEEEPQPKKRALSRFEAQLIVNKNNAK